MFLVPSAPHIFTIIFLNITMTAAILYFLWSGLNLSEMKSTVALPN